jgi:DNA-binding transcriptional regulator YiaG
MQGTMVKDIHKWDRSRIKALRGYLDMTQVELADEMGIRQQTVSEWETGIYIPRGASIKLLTMIAERAGFSYEAKENEGSAD